MNASAIVVIFTLFSAPVDVAPNAPLTLEPDVSIAFQAASDTDAATKKVWTQCERFAKAAQQAGMLGFCGQGNSATAE